MTSSRTQPIASDKAELQPGDVLVGKFRVERVVGRGGMGVVIEATNLQLDQRVALKLLATGANDPAVVERFSHEARAAARLRSEHVARVYDVGEDAERGPFIVMELLEGRTLADVILATGRSPLHRAVEYIIDACEGLAEAHARGIIHLDVKPANLFLVEGSDGKPSIKLLDFGIAAMRTKERETNTSSSHPSAGTPAYLAPEQLRQGKLDHRVDIWSLGCVLYELLVGDRPFRAARFTELVTKILETEPEPIPADLEVPVPVRAAVMRCLEKDPTKRFASTGELALTLLPFARRRAHSAVTRAVAHVKSGGLDPHLEMPSSMPPPPSSGGEIESIPLLRTPNIPGPAAGAPAAAPATHTSSDSHQNGHARSARSRRLAILVASGLLGVGGVSIVMLATRPSTPVGTPDVSAATPSASTSSAPVDPVASVTSSATSRVPTPSSESASSIPSRTPVRSPEPTRPQPKPRPAASPLPNQPTTQPSDTEIRHTR